MKVQYSLLPLLSVGPAVADYLANTRTAVQTLQDKLYNKDTGLWKGAKDNDVWWQSGHILETIARFGIADESYKQTAKDIVANTYEKSAHQQGYTNWHNDFYDDMGWWAQGWIAAYDLTGDQKYLDTAKDLYEDMRGGTSPCGGIFWNKGGPSVAAISNELFLSVGAHLANRVGADEKKKYSDWAFDQWHFFWNSGLINDKDLINDGLDSKTCKNNGHLTMTYNMGVILAGLVELKKALPDMQKNFIDHANDLANATLHEFTKDGIFQEHVPYPLNEEYGMFRGAFFTGLSTLQQYCPHKEYADFFKLNADAAWDKGRKQDGLIKDSWFGETDNANVGTHISGADILLGAALA